MPELPDVAAFKRYFDRTVLHVPVQRVEVLDESMLEGISRRSLQYRLKGARFEETERHGKHLFAHFKDDEWLMLHFGMTGDLEYYARDGEVPPHTRVQFDFEDGHRLAYTCMRKLGKVGITSGPRAFAEEHDLGPDALDHDLVLESFRARLEGRHGSIKAALMDQQTVAGIGNVYSDEILFQAGIHPKASVSELDDDDLKSIHRSMRRVLRTAVDNNADPEELPGTYIIPQRHEGGRCPRCGGDVESVKVSGRTAWICPNCQKKK